VALNLERLLDVIPCGVVSFDDDGTVTYANATLLETLGYERGEVEGRHVENLLGMAGKLFFQTHLYPLVRLQGSAAELFVLFRHKSGVDVGALVNARREFNDGRAVIHCAVTEVRERRKFEDALLRAKQAAEAANATLSARTREVEDANKLLAEQQHLLEEQAAEMEAQSEELAATNESLQTHGEELERARTAADHANNAKSQFLATMSHELRTPLNAIGGYVQLIELEIHGPVTAEQRGALDRVMRAQRHLLRLVNDVLNLARIEAGRVDYARDRVDVANLVEGVLPMVEPQMKAAALTATVDVMPGLFALADSEKVQQIAINLLTNAVKFTPPGGQIRVKTRRDPEGGALIIVSDTGIGIPDDKLASIFEPFVQVDTAESGRREGSGLGLAISRDLARGMGGDLRVTSKIGQGSTFTLTLPPA
jgi:PAS domain S-box-containing protein